MMAKKNSKIAEKTIERLSFYRRILEHLKRDGVAKIHSPVLAERAHVSAVQVRRDLMVVKYYGNPAQGYEIGGLITAIDSFLDHPRGTNAILIGIGNLGRAVLEYFQDRRPRLRIVAAFDKDPSKADRDYHGTRSYPPERLPEIIKRHNVTVGIICVPASEANRIASILVEHKISGILNFAPVRLSVPPNVYLEDVDLIARLEKVAYFSRPSSASATDDFVRNDLNDLYAD